MGFRIDLDWPGDARRSIELNSVQPARAGLAVEKGSIRATLTADEASYVTHGVSGGIKTRPEDAFPAPRGPVRIQLANDFVGRGLSLWLLQYRGDSHLKSERWHLKQGTTEVDWTPVAGADGIRIALRVAGTGTVQTVRVSVTRPAFSLATLLGPLAGARDSLRSAVASRLRPMRRAATAARPAANMAVSGMTAPKPRKAPDAWLRSWEALNRPKAELPEFGESVLSAHLRPETAIGPRPEHIRLEADRSVGADAYRRLEELGCKPDALDFDSMPFGREISPKLLRALETGRYESSCPYTGRALSSADTFLVSYPEGKPYVFVRFDAEDSVFYDVYDGFGGARIGMYLPGDNVVVSRLNILGAVAYLKYAVLRHAFEVVRYLKSAERRPAVTINTMNHCGHWLLCEVEALSRIVESGLASHVDEWVDCMYRFIDTAKLLPGIEVTNAVTGSEAMFRNALLGGHFVLLPRIGHYFIGERAREAIAEYVAGHKSSTGYEAVVQNRLEGRWPVIWMEWRANDRIWLNQKEGLAALIERMRRRYPDFAIVIAGWSRMNIPRAEDEAMIEKEEAVFAEIAASMDAPELHFISGETLANKLVWADHCDFYVTVHGTGVVFPLLAGLPGMVVGNREDAGRFRSAGGPAAPPQYVFGEPLLDFAPLEMVRDDPEGGHWQTRSFLVEAEPFANLIEEKMGRELEESSLTCRGMRQSIT